MKRPRNPEQAKRPVTRSPERSKTRITSPFFTVHIQTDKGTFDLRRADGTRFVTGATSALNIKGRRLALTSTAFSHEVRIIPFSDRLGSGRKLVMQSSDSKSELEIETHLALYDNLSAATVETVCRNRSLDNLSIYSVEPFCAVESETGSVYLPGVSKGLTNGAIYYDAGLIHTFGTPFTEPEPYGKTKGGKLTEVSLSARNETVTSWWNIGLYCGYDREALVIGYMENDSGLGRIICSRFDINELSVVVESVFASGQKLKPSQAIHSNRLMILSAPDPYTALETYADCLGRLHQARTGSIINGWCNWFYTYDLISEEEVLRNAEFAARHLKPFGLEYMQIDEGYQRRHGDWEGNDRFPHGMKWLADNIKRLGLKPAIWVAPYVVSESAPVFREHPDWFLKNPDGSPKRIGPWPSEDSEWAVHETPKRYCLDITHPGAAKWLHDLIATISQSWGYEMIKIDFVAWSILSAEHFYDASVTPAKAYRRGYEIMRQAIGDNRHLMECGPGPISVGLIDSMRIELDQNYGYGKEAWRQYFADASASGPAIAKRYYYHRKAWINDADHVCLNLLSPSQARAAATLIALSGGNMISGDRLTILDEIKLDILKKVLPSYGETARPVDLFDNEWPSVLALKIHKPFGEWTVLGVFNASLTDLLVKNYSLERLWLNPEKTYLAYDFWEEKFRGEVTGEISVSVQPASVTLLSLHEKLTVPQFISTSRHVLQGAIEIENIGWSPGLNSLWGISKGPLNTAHHVSVYLPEPIPWIQGKAAVFHDATSHCFKMVDDHILRVHIRFDREERVEWAVDLGGLYAERPR